MRGRCFGSGLTERSAAERCDPERAHELQARQAAELSGVPLAQARVGRQGAGDRIFDDAIAEIIDDGGNGENAA